MRVIADSGSTKTDWVILNDKGEVEEKFITKGFNPNYSSSLFIVDELKKCKPFLNHLFQIKQIFFYGSGCATQELNNIIISALQSFHQKLQIQVFHDLYASVHSTAGNKPAIVCILGTGSNACFFDGQQISYDDFSLGYLLGDEGSGSYFGKRILHDYFYQKLPADLYHDFEKSYHLKRNDVIERIYREERPNEFLASFMPFFQEFKNHTYCLEVLKDGFQKFIDAYILRIPQAQHFHIHTTGSIAFHFKEIWESQLDNNHLNIGKTYAKPMDGLITYIANKFVS